MKEFLRFGNVFLVTDSILYVEKTESNICFHLIHNEKIYSKKYDNKTELDTAYENLIEQLRETDDESTDENSDQDKS